MLVVAKPRDNLSRYIFAPPSPNLQPHSVFANGKYANAHKYQCANGVRVPNAQIKYSADPSATCTHETRVFCFLNRKRGSSSIARALYACLTPGQWPS